MQQRSEKKCCRGDAQSRKIFFSEWRITSIQVINNTNACITRASYLENKSIPNPYKIFVSECYNYLVILKIVLLPF